VVAKDPIIRQPPGQPPLKPGAVPQPVVVYRPGDAPAGSGPGGQESAAPGGGQVGGPVGPAQYIYIQTIVPGVGGPSAPAPAITHHGPAAAPMMGAAYGSQVPPIMAGQPFKPPARQVLVRYGGVGVRPRQRGTSALGVAALALGIVACAIYWVPSVGSAAVPIAMVGCALGVAGAVAALVFGRSRAGLPMTGVLVCALAAGIAVAGPDQLRAWWTRARMALHGIAVLPARPANAGGAGSASSQNAAAMRDILVRLDNLVSATDSKLRQEPGPQPGGPTANGAPNAPANGAANGAADGATVGVGTAIASRSGRPTVMAALEHLEASRRNARERALASPTMAAVVTAAEQARKHLDELRKTAAPGSAELRDADNAWMNALGDAANQLHEAVESDAQVAAARQRYQEAYDAVRRPATAPVAEPAAGNAAGE